MFSRDVVFGSNPTRNRAAVHFSSSGSFGFGAGVGGVSWFASNHYTCRTLCSTVDLANWLG